MIEAIIGLALLVLLVVLLVGGVLGGKKPSDEVLANVKTTSKKPKTQSRPKPQQPKPKQQPAPVETPASAHTLPASSPKKPRSKIPTDPEKRVALEQMQHDAELKRQREKERRKKAAKAQKQEQEQKEAAAKAAKEAEEKKKQAALEAEEKEKAKQEKEVERIRAHLQAEAKRKEEEEAERRRQEEAERKAAELKRKREREEAARKQKALAEKRQQEAEEKAAKEAALKREKEEQRKKAREEKKAKLEAEAARKAEEQKKRDEERKKREEVEMERKRKEAEQQAKEEAERQLKLKQEQEAAAAAAQKLKEEQEQKEKEEQERKEKEEQERKAREQKEKEEQEKKRREAEAAAAAQKQKEEEEEKAAKAKQQEEVLSFSVQGEEQSTPDDPIAVSSAPVETQGDEITFSMSGGSAPQEKTVVASESIQLAPQIIKAAAPAKIETFAAKKPQKKPATPTQDTPTQEELFTIKQSEVAAFRLAETSQQGLRALAALVSCSAAPSSTSSASSSSAPKPAAAPTSTPSSSSSSSTPKSATIDSASCPVTDADQGFAVVQSEVAAYQLALTAQAALNAQVRTASLQEASSTASQSSSAKDVQVAVQKKAAASVEAKQAETVVAQQQPPTPEAPKEEPPQSASTPAQNQPAPAASAPPKSNSKPSKNKHKSKKQTKHPKHGVILPENVTAPQVASYIRFLKFVRKHLDGTHTSVRSLFDQLDKDHDKSIDADEFLSGLKAIDAPFKDQELTTILSFLDTDHDGAIDFGEFTTKAGSPKQLEAYVKVYQELLEKELNLGITKGKGVVVEKEQPASNGVTADISSMQQHDPRNDTTPVEAVPPVKQPRPQQPLPTEATKETKETSPSKGGKKRKNKPKTKRKAQTKDKTGVTLPENCTSADVAVYIKFLKFMRTFLTQERTSVAHLFDAFDTDHDKALDLDEFVEGIHKIKAPVTDKEISTIVEFVDTDHDGTLDFQEFTTKVASHKMLESYEAVYNRILEQEMDEPTEDEKRSPQTNGTQAQALPSAPIADQLKHAELWEERLAAQTASPQRLQLEYFSINEGEDQTFDASRKHRSLNRYSNVNAYDATRAVITPSPHVNNTDYINGNYVTGYNKPKEYIATQGPITPTFNSFWALVWEHDSNLIVMVTNEIEKGRRKCDRYWPSELNKSKTYGEYEVTLLKETTEENFIRRDFTLSLCSGDSRTVRHVQYTKWPDHGQPETTNEMIDFRREVRSLVDPAAGPIVIHCSAGVGRTGTFIAIDRLMHALDEQKDLNVLEVVKDMRRCRMMMVQAPVQYHFVHHALLDVVRARIQALKAAQS
eukprot:m.123015 g.123015  ORF g.123015 m.123015 type:complete len:1312 (-) comp23370_c0_seq1:161-4096(-)